MSTKWANFFERVLWTLVQALSAEVILQGYEALRGQLDAGTHGIALVVLTTVVAAIKNAAAQAFGSPTGSTLSEAKRPVPAEAVVAQQTDTGVVAGTAAPIPTGSPVLVTAGTPGEGGA